VTDTSIEMILPYPQGGGSDQRARLTAKYLGRHLGREVNVVNRTGAVTGHTAIAQPSSGGGPTPGSGGT
jgi:tripartite-type tricarboxylate transporter receptor subunit TctC